MMPGMSGNRLLGISFVVSLAVWAWCSWPLPRHAASGIPSAAHRAPADVQRMVPGDHLQFMYYCRLAGDMVSGRTPLFYNLYEFNTGDDRERFEPDAYYIPFSLVYAAGAALGGQAFGWNLAGFVSLWLTFLLTWLLARRWTSASGSGPAGEWIAAVAALPGIVLPFRWINLFGGSPAGFAMAWIPAILLGVDLAVREDRVRGGVLAGLAILMAAWGDQHVFFFGTLAAPAWGVVAFTARPDFDWRRGASYGRLAAAVLPIAVLAGAALLFPVLMKWLARAVTGLAPAAHAVGPRSIREILLFSPDWRGFFGMSAVGLSPQIYLGAVLPALITAGWLAWLDLACRRKAGPYAYRLLLVVTLLGLGIAGVAILALGPRGPDDGLFFRIARRLIPPYAMIRQPAKIFCLMPSLLAAASALALAALVQLRSGRRWRILLPVLVAGGLLLECRRQVHPTISLLEKRQGAYAAVAADAAAGQAVPRALVLPLWPGDSHYASIYQYFAALYRVRMLNGYNPFIRQGYFDNVFRRFESANQGGLSDEQIEGLLGMGVRYLILHENLFPEKVSPFPVASTLRQLLDQPRLELLRQDGSVWAFKIPDAPRAAPATAPLWEPLFPARRFEMEKTSAERRVTVKLSPAAGGGGYVALDATNASLKTAPIRVASVSNLRWLVRARGSGMLAGESMADGLAAAPAAIAVQSPEWTWLNVSVPAYRGFAAVSLKLALQSGAVDLDVGLLTAGAWRMLEPGESVVLPAPLFFHAGHIDRASGSVVLRRDIDPQGIAFYGPKLPLPRGAYAVDIDFSSPALPDTGLGAVNLEQQTSAGGNTSRPLLELRGGRPARGRWRQEENLPFNLVLVYSAAADLAIRRVVLTRIK